MNFYTFLKKTGLLFLCCWIAVNAFGQTAQTINPSGGASASFNDGLKVVVNTNGSLAVYRANMAQYCCGNIFPNGSTGGVTLSFRFSEGTNYSNVDRGLTACSTTQAVQVGNNWTTSISGYVTSPISNQRFYVTMNFTYTHPNNFFYVDYYVRAPYASSYVNPETVHLYLSHDANIKGSDGSRGMMTQNASGHFVGDFRLNSDNTSTCARYLSGVSPSCHGFKTAGTFRSYFSGAYSSRDTKTSSNMLSNTMQTASCIDDGVAVEFTIGPLSQGQTGVRRILHGYGDTQGEFDQTTVTDPTVPSGSSSPVTVNFASATFSETEGAASHAANSIQITVGGGQLAQSQICNFTISGGTAVQNTDYSYVKGFTIPAGNYTTPQTFTLNNVTIIGNTSCQSNRTFNVNVDSEICNELIVVGSTNQTTVTIVDDDLPTVTQPVNGGPYCSGIAIPATSWVFSGSTVPGTVYEWSATNAAAIGLPASSGTANIPAFTTVNATNAAIVSTVTVTPKQGTCSGTAKTFTITVNPSPVLTQPSNQTLCAGENSTAVAFSGTNVDAATSTWAVTTGSGTGIGMSANSGTGNIPVFTAINTGTASVSVTITVTPKSTDGCTGATKTFTITVNPLPALTQPSNQTLCAGVSSAAVTFSGTNVDAATSTWAVTTGSGTGIGMSANSGTGNIPVFTAINTGTASVSVTITVTPKSIVGCTGATKTFTITVNPLPALTQPSNQTLCAGENSTAIAFSGTNVDAATSTWAVTTGSGTGIGMSFNSGTGNIPVFSAINTGSSPVSVTITVTPKSTAGCTGATKTFTITVNPLPVLTQPSTQTLCFGASIDLATVVTNPSNYTLSYYTSSTGGTALSSSTVSPSPGTTTYYVESKNSNGCVSSIRTPVVITVKSIPTATLTGATGVVVSEQVTYTAGAGSNYHWSVTGGTITSGGTTADATATVTWGAAGSGSISVDYTSNGCPTNTATVNTTIVAQGTPVISNPVTSLCYNTTQTYSTTSGKYNYLWTVTGGTIDGNVNNQSTVSVTWGAAGSGTIKVAYSEVSSATAITSPVTNVTINNKPTVGSVSAPAGVCDGSALTLTTPTVTSVPAASSQGWNLDNASFTSGSLIALAKNGKTLYYEVTNACGTTNSNNTTITVYALPTVTTTAQSICYGSSINLTSTVTNPSNYTLSFYTVSTGGTALSSSTVSPSGPGATTYYVESTNSNGCISLTRTPVVITVKSIPTATLTGTTGVVESEQVTYTAGAGSNYHWSVTGGTITSGGTTADATATVTWGTAGLGSISVDYTSNGCPTTTATVNTTIVAQGTPVIDSPVTSLCYNTTQTYSTTSGKYNYLWTVIGGTVTSGQGTANATVTWGAAGSGTIKVAYSEALAATAITSPVTNVTINNKPTVGSISAPAGVCDGSTLTLTTPTVTSVPAESSQGWKLNSVAHIPGTTVSLAQHSSPLYYEATNVCGTTTSNTVNITVYALPTVTTTAQLICPTTSVDLATTVANPSNYTLSYYTVSTGGTALSSSSVTPTATTTYYVESTNSNGCVSLTRTPVTITLKTVTAITVQPVSPSVIGLGNPFTLNVTAVGENLTYQWYKNSTLIIGATLDSYSVASATTADYGNYSVVVSGDCGTVQTSSTVTVNILSPDATLKDLLVDGTSVPEFDPQVTQYTCIVPCELELTDIIGIKNHVNATVVNPSNVNLELGDNWYSIIVTAENGFTTKTYMLNVIRDCYIPKITKDLDDAVICLNGTHSWEIEAKGNDLTYEWYKGEKRIMGQNSPRITFTDAQFSDYDRYYVIVRSNYNGFKSSIQSKKVRLWVADYLPEHLKLAEYPNPATVGKTSHVKVDGYVDVTKYSWSYSKAGVTFSPAVTLYNDNETWATFGTLSEGTGILKVTMEHPCGTRELTQTITVNYPTGVDDVTATVVTVYPNPTSGILKVSGTVANQMIRVTDVTGSLKGSYKTQEGTTMIDLTGYAKGTYMLQYNGKAYKVIKK